MSRKRSCWCPRCKRSHHDNPAGATIMPEGRPGAGLPRVVCDLCLARQLPPHAVRWLNQWKGNK